jgi:COMPASS component SWD2
VSEAVRTYRPSKVRELLSLSPDNTLTDSHNQRFKLSKHENSHITSLDFDDKGEFVVAACEDETIQVYDVIEGKNTKIVPSKKYGAHLARFTHHQRQVLHASTKVDGM